jgi:hypothetical protein
MRRQAEERIAEALGTSLDRFDDDPPTTADSADAHSVTRRAMIA